jgi:RNA polymerase sigma factor (sigma-70 family)
VSTGVTSPETRPADDVAALYIASSRKLLGLVLAVGDNPADAEDIVHEAYARLLMSWHRVSRYENPEAWLRTVAVRIIISRHRRRRRAAQALALLRNSSARFAEEPSPEPVTVLEALHRLPMTHRVVVVMHYYLDLDVTTIAKEFEIPVGTVKSRLGRARAGLGALLTEEYQP